MEIRPVPDREHSGMPEKAVDELCLTIDLASCADPLRYSLNRFNVPPQTAVIRKQTVS
jgi:hypothetical protein